MSGPPKPRRRGKLTVVPDDFPGMANDSGVLDVSYKERNRALLKEVAELEAALEADITPETWAEHTPQDLRDQYAASALVASGLHPQRALARLGFKIESSAERKRVAAEIFGRPEVQAILSGDAEKFAGKKTAVQNRLYNAVLTEAPDVAIRAAGQLCKMIPGWQEGEIDKRAAQSNMNLLLSMFGGAASARVVGSAAVAELPPGEEIIDADSFFVDRGDDVVAVVDDPK